MAEREELKKRNVDLVLPPPPEPIRARTEPLRTENLPYAYGGQYRYFPPTHPQPQWHQSNSTTQSNVGYDWRSHPFIEHPQRPSAPAMQSFGGESTEWESFRFHFEHMATSFHWDDSEKLNRLLWCMRDRAIDFIMMLPVEVRSSFRRLMVELEWCFGQSELTSAKGREYPHKLDNIAAAERNVLTKEVVQNTAPAPNKEKNFPSPVICHKCRREGHMARDCLENPPSPSRDPSSPPRFKSWPSPRRSPNRPNVCFTCSKPGHFSKDCPNAPSVSGKRTANSGN